MRLANLLTRRRLRRLAITVASLVTVWILLALVVLPPIVRGQIVKRASAALHREVRLGKVRIHPFTLAVRLVDFELKERDGSGPFVAFDELLVDLQLASVWSRGPVLREVVLARPRVHVVRGPDGRFNFSDIIDEAMATPPDPEARPLRFSLNNIRILDGSVDFDDRAARERHAITGITLAAPFLSNLPYATDVFVEPAFAATINGTTLALRGRTKPFSDTMETSLDIDLKDLDVPRYLAYAALPIRARVASARLDTALTLTFTRQSGGAQVLALSGRVTLRETSVVDEAGAPVVAVPRIEVDIARSRILDGALDLARVLVDAPDLRLARDREGQLDLIALITPRSPDANAKNGQGKGVQAGNAQSGNAQSGNAQSSNAQPAAPSKSAFALTAAEVRIARGRLAFRDASTPQPFATVLHPIDLTLRHLSLAPGRPTEVSLAITTDAGETIGHEGEVTLAPLAARGRITVKGHRPDRIAPYWASRVRFDIVSGTIDVVTDYTFAAASPSPKIALGELAVTVSDLALRRRGERTSFATLPRLELQGTTVDVTEKKLALGTLMVRGGTLAVGRAPDGTISLTELVAPPPPAPRRAPAAPAKPATATTTPATTAASTASTRTGITATATLAQTATPTPTAASRPWLVTLRKLDVAEWTVSFEDRGPAQPVRLVVGPLRIGAADVSTAPGSRGTVAIRTPLNRRGLLSIEGSVGIDPLAADLQIDARGLDVVPLQPYFTERLTALLTRGLVSAAGRLTLADAGTAGLRVGWRGRSALARLVLVDKESSEDLLRWESLDLRGVDVGTAPLRVRVGEVALADFFARIAVAPDGTLNVSRLVREPPPPAGSSPAGAAPPSTQAPAQPSTQAGSAPARPAAETPIRIDKITLQAGTIAFTDRSVRNGYSAMLSQIGGRISGLSSSDAQGGDVDLRGRYEDAAPLAITGKVNPLSKELLVDLKIDFRDLDLSPLTPYSGKYAGYAIQKGKLSLALQYKIAERKLEASNNVFIDQFTFGDRIDSPDATRLPVRLAVALLQDRRGEIHLDLPVSGSLDDPEFSIWRLVLKVVVNLLEKAATAPFALLGALFGGGEELSHLELGPGAESPDSDGEGKLRALARVLHERPGLKLEITGHVDPDRDREGLRQRWLDRKIKAQKLKEQARGETAPIPTESAPGVPAATASGASIDDVVVAPADEERLLRLVFAAERFPKPRDALGIEKRLPVAEMKKLILANTVVGDGDLRLLAIERARRVRDRLLRSGQVESERLFLVEPRTLAPESKRGARQSRVDFVLR